MNIGILFGGKSQEHEVSCLSAHSIYTNIDRNKYRPYLIGITKEGKFRYFKGDINQLLVGQWEDLALDVPVDILGNNGPTAIYDKDQTIVLHCIFPVLHGPYGEDGRVQGILDYAGIPYVGNGLLSSAICMDKGFTKDLLRLHNIPQTKYLVLNKGEEEQAEEALKDFKYPVFVKPANLGSSVGISKVKTPSDVVNAIKNALKYDNKVLVEEGVNCREIECSVLEAKGDVYTSSLGELIVYDEFYDYDSKYINNTTKLEIPADLSSETVNQIKEYAKKVFKLLGCRSIARVDFFIDKDTGKIIINEVNTMPGFTSISMYPKLLDYDGINYSELIDKLISSAVEDYE